MAYSFSVGSFILVRWCYASVSWRGYWQEISFGWFEWRVLGDYGQQDVSKIAGAKNCKIGVPSACVKNTNNAK